MTSSVHLSTRARAVLRSSGVRALAAGLIALLVVVLTVLWMPWDWLRGPLNRYVSERTGRHFEIQRRLEVHPGWTSRVKLEGIVFANPPWAKDPYLIRAESAEFEVRLPSLLSGRLDLPSLVLHRPELGLQIEADGRRTWALGRETADPGNVPRIGSLTMDGGALHFVAPAEGADVRAAFELKPSDTGLPLHFQAKGRWKGQAVAASGRTGSVLALEAPSARHPFPVQVSAMAGQTSLRATGTLASLVSAEGADANVELRGASLADLYGLLGVVLPETPRYTVRGRLSRQGPVWSVSGVQGKLGRSDLSGDLSYDMSSRVPLLTGALRSAELDFDDLAPLVGLPEQARSATAPDVKASVAAAPSSAGRKPLPGKVLPVARLDLERLKAMNADVRYRALDIAHAGALPLQRADVHVHLRDGVLELDPLQLGVAGGGVAGRLRINGASDPASVVVNLDMEGLHLNQLFPAVKSTRSSLGQFNGRIDLAGEGNNVARMLATSSGNVSMLMGQGEISNLLLEFAGLDGGEIIKFLVRGDRNVSLRCAAAAFDVRQGLMTSRTMVLDTSDTVVQGAGRINLADETLDVVLRPQPKDASILSLRSPLKIAGSFAAPQAGPDKMALAGRAGAALALAAVNPLLALAATVETGPGQDVDCLSVLSRAATPAISHRAR
ncbi:MAG: AsmA family protein [Ramlibacter sp.]|nr:AsmA family protein [Ramlibacter sp.]